MGRFFLGLSTVLLIVCAYLLHQNQRQKEQLIDITEFTSAMYQQCVIIERERDYYKHRAETI